MFRSDCHYMTVGLLNRLVYTGYSEMLLKLSWHNYLLVKLTMKREKLENKRSLTMPNSRVVSCIHTQKKKPVELPSYRYVIFSWINLLSLIFHL